MAILLTPLWLACLSPAEYGTLELLTTLQNLVTLLIGFNISPLLSTTYYKLEEQERSHFIRQVSATALYATLISMPLLIGSAPFIQHFFFRHTVSISLILITIATGIAWIFIQMIYRVFALERKATQLTALQLTYGITMLAGSCLFVIGFKWRLTGALLIRLIAATLLCMVAIAVRSDRTLLPTRTSLARAAHYFKEGATFYPLFIAEWFFLSGNQWIIARYGSLYDVGIYALALKVGLLFQVVVTTPLNNAYAPYLYQQYEGENTILQTEKSNRKTMLSSLALLLVVSITGYYITRPFVHFFLPKAYHPALGYILGILIGQILYVGTTFATYLLRYQKRTLTCAWITLLSAGTTASLSIILIPSYGNTGGILAAITGNALLFLLALYYNARPQKNCVMNPPPNSAHNIPTTPLLKGAIMKPEQLVYHIESIGIYLESGPYNKWRTTTVSTLAEALGKQVPKNAPITYKVILHDAAYMPTPERMTTIPGTASYTDLHIALPRSSFFRQQTSDYQIDIWTDGEHFNIAHILQDIFPAMHKTFVHGAGLIINGEGVLIPAYSGIGKTILMAHMAKQPPHR